MTTPPRAAAVGEGENMNGGASNNHGSHPSLLVWGYDDGPHPSPLAWSPSPCSDHPPLGSPSPWSDHEGSDHPPLGSPSPWSDHEGSDHDGELAFSPQASSFSPSPHIPASGQGTSFLRLPHLDSKGKPLVYPPSFLVPRGCNTEEVHTRIVGYVASRHNALSQFTDLPYVLHDVGTDHCLLQYTSVCVHPGDMYVISTAVGDPVVPWVLEKHKDIRSPISMTGSHMVAKRYSPNKPHLPVLFSRPDPVVRPPRHTGLPQPIDDNILAGVCEFYHPNAHVVPVVDPSTGTVREYVIDNDTTRFRPYMVDDPHVRDRLFPGNARVKFDIAERLHDKRVLLQQNTFVKEAEFMTPEDVEDVCERGFDVVGIKADFGFRKSTSTFKYLATTRPNDPVFMFSVRRTHAEDAGKAAFEKGLTLHCYLDLEKGATLTHLNKVIVSPESSLRRIDAIAWIAKYPGYTLLLDEECEILRIYTLSSTMQQREEAFEVFRMLVANARQVLLITRDLEADDVERIVAMRTEDKRTVGLLRMKNPDAEPVTLVPLSNTADYKHRLFEDLDKGLLIAEACASRRVALERKADCSERNISCLCVHGLSGDEQIDLLSEMETGANYQLVVFTPVIGSGFSIPFERDRVYLHTLSTNAIASTCQMVGRARHVISKEIIAYIPDVPARDTDTSLSGLIDRQTQARVADGVEREDGMLNQMYLEHLTEKRVSREHFTEQFLTHTERIGWTLATEYTGGRVCQLAATEDSLRCKKRALDQTRIQAEQLVLETVDDGGEALRDKRSNPDEKLTARDKEILWAFKNLEPTNTMTLNTLPPSTIFDFNDHGFSKEFSNVLHYFEQNPPHAKQCSTKPGLAVVFDITNSLMAIARIAWDQRALTHNKQCIDDSARAYLVNALPTIRTCIGDKRLTQEALFPGGKPEACLFSDEVPDAIDPDNPVPDPCPMVVVHSILSSFLDQTFGLKLENATDNTKMQLPKLARTFTDAQYRMTEREYAADVKRLADQAQVARDKKSRTVLHITGIGPEEKVARMLSLVVQFSTYQAAREMCAHVLIVRSQDARTKKSVKEVEVPVSMQGSTQFKRKAKNIGNAEKRLKKNVDCTELAVSRAVAGV